MEATKKISIVTALYHSNNYVTDFYNQYKTQLNEITNSYEFIFVDDGCPKKSHLVAQKLIEHDNNVRVVKLSRNFGQQIAMFAGIQHASGDLIFTADCDLEENPENLIHFLEKMREFPDNDLIFGHTENREGGFVRGYLGGLFYRILTYMSGIKIQPNQTWQRLMTKRFAKSLLLHTEADSLPIGLLALTGYNQLAVLTEKKYKGSSSYTSFRRLKIAINSIFSLSSKPLVLIALLGFFITAVSTAGALYILVAHSLGNTFLTGWTSIFVSLWLISGLILTSLGVIGIYISKIYMSVKNRPKYIVKEIL